MALLYTLTQTKGLGQYRLSGVSAIELAPAVYVVSAQCNAKRVPEDASLFDLGESAVGRRRGMWGVGMQLCLESGASWRLVVWPSVSSSRCLWEFRYGPQFIVFPDPSFQGKLVMMKRLQERP